MQGVRGSNPLSSTRHNAPAGPPPMAAMACQRFARDDASVCHAHLRVAAWAEPVDLRERGGTDSETQGFEVAARAWHARGQGFKSPQLHQAQHIRRTPAQGRLSADCQQITPCDGNNTLSVDRSGDFGVFRARSLARTSHKSRPAPRADSGRPPARQRHDGHRGTGPPNAAAKALGFRHS
jgi:hypothetical protein